LQVDAAYATSFGAVARPKTVVAVIVGVVSTRVESESKSAGRSSLASILGSATDSDDIDDEERIKVVRKRPKQQKKASDGLMVKIETTKPKQEAESLAVIASHKWEPTHKVLKQRRTRTRDKRECSSNI
jgi:hypothetical protein